MKVSKRKGPGIVTQIPYTGYGMIGLAIAAARLEEQKRKQLEEKLRGDNAPKRRHKVK